MKIAVLGGGSGAHAMAADLALAGHEIRLAELPAFRESIAAVRADGGITLTGAAPMGGEPGFARIALATSSFAEALGGAELVMLVVPAYGHEAFMRELVTHAERGQVVVVNSGYFGAPLLSRMLAEAGRSGELLVGETTSLIYLARLKGPGQVWIKAAKRRMPFAALPASRTGEALRVIRQVYPQFSPAANVFETSLNEAGVLVHPVATLLNMARIEAEGPYQSSYYDLSPGMGRVMDAVDRERQALQGALGLRPLSLPGMIRDFFGVEGEGSYAAIRACPNYASQTTPDSLSHRYFAEDVPYGLVPVASLGAQLGLEVAATEAVITLAGLAAGRDFRAEGRDAGALGFAGLDAAAMLRAVSA